jgi:hypothetical protein
MDKPRLKQRIIHELGKFLRVFLFLAPFFCAFATYRMAILEEFRGKYFAYGAALVKCISIVQDHSDRGVSKTGHEA